MAARAGKVPRETFDELMENLSYDADAEVSTFTAMMSSDRPGDPRQAVVTARTPGPILEIFADDMGKASPTKD